MKTSNFRHKVFCMAYELMKATGKAFAVCLSRAWALYRLTRQMHKGVVSFAYEKVLSKTFRIVSKGLDQKTSRQFATSR